MKVSKKISLNLLVFFLVFQSFNTPIYALATSSENQANEFTEIVMEDLEEDISIYEEASDSSEVIQNLSDGDSILLIESEDDFLYIEHIDSDNLEKNRGYVLYDDIEFLLDESSNLENDNDNPSDEEDEESVSDNNPENEAPQEDSEDPAIPDEESNDESNESIDSDEEKNSSGDESDFDQENSIQDSDEESDDVEAEDNENAEADSEERKSDSVDKDNEKSSIKVNTFSTNSSELLQGIALNNQTHVYSETSTNSKVKKSYPAGSILKYYDYSNGWYRTGVFINGVKEVGYINKSHVENAMHEQILLDGISLKNNTPVYEKASKDSNIRKSYSQGSILKFYTFSDNWYETGVIINGKKVTGYIHKSDIELPVENPVLLEGVALKDKTTVYTKASTGSSKRKDYSQGSILKFYTFSDNWYKTGVIIDGKKVTGYIAKSDIELPVDSPVLLEGIALKDNTAVYTSASKNSNKRRDYSQGSILKFYTFTNNWYKTGVYINGKKETGYIHKSDVEIPTENPKLLEGVALKNKTPVYSKPSKNSSVRKSYSQGSILKYYTFTDNWYKTGVFINGEKVTGYIHKSDVSEHIESHYNISLNKAAEIQQKANAQTDKNVGYVHKSYIKNNKVTATTLNVRSGPGTNYGTVGQLKNNDTVKINSTDGDWHQIDFKGNKQWVNASLDDISYYLDPNNFINDPLQRFQFLDLSKPSGASLSSLNSYLSGQGILSGHGQSFLDGGRTHQVNEAYLMSHSLLETGNGTSKLAQGIKVGLNSEGEATMVTSSNENSLTNIKTVYNMYGIGAVDSCPDKCGSERAYEEGWTTPEKAIVGGAKFIGEKYIHGNNITNTKQNTLYKMRWNPEYMANNNVAGHQYATDIGWAYKQVSRIAKIYEGLGNNSLVLDIPIYK